MNELYKSKLVTAKEAAKVVKSGNWVDYGWTVTTPVDFDKELAKRLPELHDVNFRGGILMWEPEIFKIEDPAADMELLAHERNRTKSCCERIFFLLSNPLFGTATLLP